MTRRAELSRAQLAAVLDRWQADGQCRWLPVAGDSMWPQLRQGDAVLVRFSHTAPRVGDVALIWPDAPAHAPLLLHRVIGIDGAGALVKTQGDNRRKPDPRHPRAAVRGIVIARRRGAVVHRVDRLSARLAARCRAWAVRSALLPLILRTATSCRRRAHHFTTRGVTSHA